MSTHPHGTHVPKALWLKNVNAFMAGKSLYRVDVETYIAFRQEFNETTKRCLFCSNNCKIPNATGLTYFFCSDFRPV